MFIGNATVNLAAKRQPRAEVVHDREAARVNMPARSLNPYHARARIARKQESEVQRKPRLVAERFLRDEVEPVISQSGAELLVLIPGRKFDVQAGCECRR